MPFSNPITGGNVLIRPAIKSPDYVPGISGWTINRDGTAEFNDATFRGEVDVVTPSGSVRIFEDGSGHPAIEFFDTNGVLKAGIVYDPVSDAMFEFGLSSGQYFDISGIFLENGAETNGVRFDDSDGFLKNGLRGTTETWHNFTFNVGNAWSNLGSPWQTCQYKKMPDGTVRLRGYAKAGTKTNGTVLGTLPSGYIPPNKLSFIATADGTISPFVCVLQVLGTSDPVPANAGQIQIFGLGTAGVASFDNISFSLV